MNNKIIKSIKQRIFEFLENQRIEKNYFYKKTLISPSNFTGTGLKSELGGDKITKILIAYPELNARWLLTGEGNMMESEKHASNGGDDRDKKIIQTQKDTITELQAKLIRCMEDKEFLNKAEKLVPIPEPKLKEPAK